LFHRERIFIERMTSTVNLRSSEVSHTQNMCAKDGSECLGTLDRRGPQRKMALSMDSRLGFISVRLAAGNSDFVFTLSSTVGRAEPHDDEREGDVARAREAEAQGQVHRGCAPRHLPSLLCSNRRECI